jgi:hypothetical protein
MPVWQTIPSPTPRLSMGWKMHLGESCPHGRSIVLVNDTKVRDRFDSDFSQGGNGYRYRFIPKREIWIDSEVNQEEWPLIAFHECREAELMKSGMSYSRAHDTAKRLEDRFRRGRKRP